MNIMDPVAEIWQPAVVKQGIPTYALLDDNQMERHALLGVIRKGGIFSLPIRMHYRPHY